MDSKQYFSYHPLTSTLGASLLGLLVSGCSSNAPQAEKKPAYKPVEVFAQAIHQQAEPGSVLRNGDKVTWLVVWKDPQQNRFLLRFDAFCSQEKGWMHYAKGRGMSTFSAGSADGSLPPEQTLQLRASAPYKAACAQTRPDDWRVVDSSDEQDWLIVDRHNIQREGNLRRVWVGHDYLHERLSLAQKSTSAQVRAQLTVDCTRQTLSYLSRYDMTASNDVMSGLLYQQQDGQDMPDAEKQALLKAACLSDTELDRLPRLQPRSKLAAQIKTPETAAAAIAAIKALNLPAPTQQLEQIDFSYDVQIFSHDIRGEKKTWHVQTDAASGQTLIRPEDKIEKPKVDLTFRGLFTLQTSHLLPADDGSTSLQNLSFAGDWQQLPSGATVSYTRTLNSNKTPREKDFPRTTECEVGKTVAASQLNTALKGDATVLSCDDLKGKAQWVKRYWYLRHYGLFIPAAEDGPLGNWRWRVDAVKLAQ